MSYAGNTSILTHEQKVTFYHKMIAIAIPVIIQNIISIGLGVADTIMIGKLGELQLAGTGAANQIFWLFWSVIFGFYSGSTAHSAQYWGAGNKKKTMHVIGMQYMVGTITGILVIVITYLFSDKLLWLFARDPVVIEYGTEYMRISCFSYWFSFISYAFIFNSRVIRKLKVVTTINCSTLLINIFLNYVFIYGNFGAPALGVRGAAIATTLSRIIELAVVLIYIMISRDHPLRVGPGQLFTFDREFLFRVLKTAIPVVVTEVTFTFLSSATFAIYGILGSSALAVIQVAQIIANMAQVMFFGLGNAAAVTIGEALGNNDDKSAFEFSKITVKLTVVLNIIVCTTIFFIAKPVSGLYGFSPETLDLLVQVLYVWGIITVPKMTNYVFVCGILRSGGDTVYTLKIDLLGNLVLQIPLALIGVLVLKMSLPICILFVNLADTTKLILCIRRFLSKKWINMYNK